MAKAPHPPIVNILFFYPNDGKNAMVAQYPAIIPPKWAAASTPDEKENNIEKKRTNPMIQHSCDLI